MKNLSSHAHRAAASLLSGLVCLGATGVCVSSASAQCPPTYSGFIGTPGLQDGYADPILAYDDGSGEKLYVGGSFSEIGGLVSQLLARYNPVTNDWERLGTGLGLGFTNGFLTSMIPFDDGGGSRLIVAGLFANAGGVANTQSIAAWNGSQWQSLSLNVPQGTAIWDMVVGDLGQGPRLFVAGGSTVTFGGIAQFDGESWSAVGTGVGIAGVFSPYIADLEIFDDGTGPALYAVGRFDTIDGQNTALAARFRNGTWQRIGFGLTRLGDSLRQLDSMTIHNPGTGPALYVGGTSFGITGVSGTRHTARWNGSNWAFVGQSLGTGRVTALRSWNNGSDTSLYFSGTAFPGINNFGKLVGNTWESVDGSLRDSSTPNRTTSGNWPSAFGMGEWRGDLVIGGSFISIGPVDARGIATLERCGNSCDYDYNQDENVDLLDAQQMAQVFVGLLTPGANWLDGDLNGDENADLTDAQLVAAYVVSGTCGV